MLLQIFSTFLSFILTVNSAQYNTVKFEKLKNMPSGCYGMAYASDGKWIYSIGGFDKNKGMTNRILGYSVATDEWFKLKMGSTVTAKLFHRAVYIPELNGIAIAGGLMTSTELSTKNIYRNPDIEVFDVNTKTVYPIANNENQGKYGGMNYANGEIYLYGGSTEMSSQKNAPRKIQYTSTFSSYNISTKEWNQWSDLPIPMETNGAIVGEYLYVFGGYDGKAHNEVYRIHLTDNQSNWELLGHLDAPLSANAITTYQQYIIMVGDYAQKDRMIVFDTQNQTWQEYRSNIKGRHMGAAVQENILYVFGGNTSSDSHNINKELYKLDLTSLLHTK